MANAEHRTPGEVTAGTASSRPLRQFAWFGSVGVLNTMTYTVLYQLCLALGSGYGIASVIGYLAGMTVSFTLNRRFTFRVSPALRVRTQLLRFVVVNALALAANVGIIAICVQTGWLDARWAFIPAVAGSVVIVFTGSKYWAFEESRSQEGSRSDHA